MNLRQRSYRGQRERGVVLFVALIVLVIMALTGLAMIRQSGSNLSIAGNIGTRQNALSGADLGTEAALAWWAPQASAGALDTDIAASGYYADWGTLDPARFGGNPIQLPWANGVLVTSDDGTGNEIRYIVERLCKNQGPETATGQECSRTPLKDGIDKSGTCDHYAAGCEPPAKTTLYRVTTRAVGPRDTVAYTQVMLVLQ